MNELMAPLQPVLLGAVLLWSARFKLFHRHAAATARRSALVSLLGEVRAVTAYRAVGGVELLVAAALILPPALSVEAVAATVLALGFLAYLGYARIAAPESSCGCMSAKRTPVRGRSLVRAGVLVVAGLIAVLPAAAGSGRYWLAALTAEPLAGLGILVAEAALIVALSPELDSAWLLPLRRLRVRLTHPLAGGSGVPLLASVQQLQLSDAYRAVAPLLTSDVREHWEDEEWRILCYAARYQGRPATAVFAVPRLRNDPADVRAALIDEATGTNLLNLDPGPEPAEAVASGRTSA